MLNFNTERLETVKPDDERGMVSLELRKAQPGGAITLDAIDIPVEALREMSTEQFRDRVSAQLSLYDAGICPVCEKVGTIEKIIRREALTVRGEPIEIDAEVRRCSNCGEIFANVNEEQANFTKAYRAYRQKHGFLHPEEIREIRERYGLGQRAFSRLLGWGEITVHRYEAGALQDETHNNELLLLKDPKNFRILFERNRERLPATVSRSIEEKLPDLVNTEMRGQFRNSFLRFKPS